MPQIEELKPEISGMSAVALEMLKTTFAAFMEHDKALISQALSQEERLNSLEKDLTGRLVEIGRAAASPNAKAQALIYADMVGDLELIGDYCKDILERVEIKIEEKLLFSEEAVKEYQELYHKTEEALDKIVYALKKGSFSLAKEVLGGQGHIDDLVDEYRRRHDQRLIDGLCSPIACNMFLNILDFTAAIYYHVKKISRSLLKLK
jgi:phosphate:Na+ symporter